MKKILVNSNVHNDLLNHIDKGRKIGAIKLLRAEANLGLKEAKEAIEKMSGQSPNNGGADIVVAPLIKRVVVDFGEGELTIDLETMELLILKDVERLGLQSCGEMLDFVKTLKAWSAGRSIGVIEPNEIR